MANRTVNVRIPAPLDAELTACCHTWRQPRSVIVRLAVRHFLANQMQVMQELSTPLDTLTAEQIEAWQALEETLAHIDLEKIAAELAP